MIDITVFYLLVWFANFFYINIHLRPGFTLRVRVRVRVSFPMNEITIYIKILKLQILT